MIKKSPLAAVAVATLLCMPAAQATSSSATLTLNSFSYQLIDLDPLDGIDPSLTFLDWNSNHTMRGRYGETTLTLADPSSSHKDVTTFQTALSSADKSINWSAVGTTSSKVTAGTGATGVQGATATLSSSTATTPAPSMYPSTNWSQSELSVLFTPVSLSAHTQLIITANFTGSVYASATGSEMASAGAYGYLSFYSNPSYTPIFSVSTAATGSVTHTDSKTGTLTIDYSNTSTSSVEKTLSLRLLTGTGNTSSLLSNTTPPVINPPAVPEPETYAMLLAGLGIVGRIARRRRA